MLSPLMSTDGSKVGGIPCTGAGGCAQQRGSGPAGRAHCIDRLEGGTPDGQVARRCGLICGESDPALSGAAQHEQSTVLSKQAAL